jgi:glycosyltransferase involved in cell wall biosynthesis
MLELSRLGHTVRLLVRLEGKIWKSDDLQDFQPVFVQKIDRGALRSLERLVRRIQYELKLPYAAFFESLRFALACQQELKGFDLFFERSSWMAYGGMLAAGWQKAPLVIEYNGDPLADLEAKNAAPHGIQRRLSVALMRRYLKSATHLVATGEGWKVNCIEKWGIATDKVSTVENGTELVQLLERGQLRAFQPYSDPDEPVTLAYLGGFYAWHGVEVLLHAFSRAISQGCDLKLILIGSGAGEEEARQLASQLGIADRVSFKGQLTTAEFAPFLAQADIGLSPYCGWAEFSGLKIFDYKAAGLPTIASGKDGQPRTLQHGQTGWIVPPCDEDALTGAILYLCSNLEVRRRLGQHARLEAEQIHGWDHTARQLEQIFHEALAHGKMIKDAS